MQANADKIADKHRSIALVAEGGGQKGIYTAGVLDAFLHEDFAPFDLHVGVSAGAQNLVAYCARSKQYAHKAISGLTTRKEFFKPSAMFTGGNVINLDWYFDQVTTEPEYLFPTDLEQLSADLHCYAVASDADSFDPHYLLTTHHNVWDNLKASSAIPFLYKPGVEINGVRLVDGGLADPLPVRWAYEQGARTIVVIRTADNNFDGESPLLERVKPLVSRLKETPLMWEMYTHFVQVYRKALAFIQKPPADLEVLQIVPKEELKSMVLGSHQDMLRYDYLMGQRAGRQFVKEFRRKFSAMEQAR